MTEIKKIAKNLKDYNPEKIILFGSYAWGKPNKNSDLDILVIKKTGKKHYERIPEVKYLRGINKPLDILVMEPSEVASGLSFGDFFITEIINKGKILYESNKSR